jgi:hypothetical protein
MRIGAAIACCLAMRPVAAQLGNAQRPPVVLSSWAVEISRKSPMVQSALNLLIIRTREVRDPKLRTETLDAIQNTETCIHHRANLGDAEKRQIVQKLMDSGPSIRGMKRHFPEVC